MSLRDIIRTTVRSGLDDMMGKIIRDLIEDYQPSDAELTPYENVKLERSLDTIEETLTDFIYKNI